MKTNKTELTLIELLAIVLIVGILAAIASNQVVRDSFCGQNQARL
ncbi:MAG: Tfp structural protein [Elusimicrobiota bacterium]|jgi:Tfp pilus assembly protein PilE|nr:Tfp structural protein [Elusimicrobiota bacterium]